MVEAAEAARLRPTSLVVVPLLAARLLDEVAHEARARRRRRGRARTRVGVVRDLDEARRGRVPPEERVARAGPDVLSVGLERVAHRAEPDAEAAAARRARRVAHALVRVGRRAAARGAAEVVARRAERAAVCRVRPLCAERSSTRADR